MKIGIVASGNDMLSLFKILNKYDHEYVIRYDFLYWPWGNKWIDFVMWRAKVWIEFLQKKWVDVIIVPPIVELWLIVWTEKNDTKNTNILPLFSEYLKEYCLKYSLVGKIWLFGDFADVELVQDLMKKFSKDFAITENQKTIKKFHFPFKYWVKEVSMWTYYLTSFSYSDFMVNKSVKFDLKYFKDADVDTLIPLNYWYFNFQRTISKFFNFNKTRFHKLDKIEELFIKLIEQISNKPSDKWWKSDYSVKVFYNGNIELLKREKRMMWMLNRGKFIETQFVKMEVDCIILNR